MYQSPSSHCVARIMEQSSQPSAALPRPVITSTICAPRVTHEGPVPSAGYLSQLHETWKSTQSPDSDR